MRNAKKIIVGALVAAAATVGLTGCVSDAHRVSDNLSTEAENFNITRDIVFYNGITDKYVAEVKGRCSVDTQEGLPGQALAVTCKIGPSQYTKDYLGLSDNVTWFALQTETSDVSPYFHEVIFKPTSIIPNIQVQAGERG
jgi:hypothetical protein